MDLRQRLALVQVYFLMIWRDNEVSQDAYAISGKLDSFCFVLRLLIYINIDSPAAIKVLNSYVIKSTCVDDCIKSLTHISYHQVKLVWVPEHQDIRGNEKTDEHAVRGSSLDEATLCNDVLTPLLVVANTIYDHALDEITTR